MSAWDNIVGHSWAVELLKAAAAHQRLGHAYLITGPDQIGKTTLARAFAQAINCEATPELRPCGQCRACRLIASDHHPDVRLVLPEKSARGNLSLKIETIRLLQRDLNLSPYEGRYQVAILKRFDAANPNAANAFLKTLEEPPDNVILLLTANDADSLLPTIASRCRTVSLRPLSAAEIEESLMVRWKTDAERAQLLAHLAGGRLGWAIQATRDQGLLQEREQQLGLLKEALQGNRSKRFDLAGKLANQPEALPELLKNWLSWWRDMAQVAFGDPSQRALPPLINIDEQEHLQALAASWQQDAVLAAFRQTDQALWQLARNANTRLVLENLFLRYPLSSSTFG